MRRWPRLLRSTIFNMDSIERLTKLFIRFPGIGERQARRFAYFILAEEMGYTEALAQAIRSARAHAHTCTRCLRIFEGDDTMCDICTDDARDETVLVVVEKSQDISAFAPIGYRGLFFNLGGLIPIVQKNVIDGTNLLALQQRVTKESQIPQASSLDDLDVSADDMPRLSEVILAFPLTPNGEHTDSVVRETLLRAVPHVRITSLGRGLATGTELEYADPTSLSASFKKRE